MNEIQTTTPFGRRSLSLGMVAAQIAAKACPAEAVVHKWQIFRAACEAKVALGVSERALSVLNALLTFHPETTLTGEGGLVVFPSNMHLSLRAHGMAPATLRRHLAVLVEAGLIIRRDSPNGKRFARKGQGGEIESAFGFDLTPLVARAREIERLAEVVRADRRALLLVRERITLYRRDIVKMIATGMEEAVAGDWAGLHKTYLVIVQQIPRSATRPQLEPIADELEFLADQIDSALEFHVNSMNPSANESQTEHHIQNSNPKPLIESELAFEEAKGEVDASSGFAQFAETQADAERGGEVASSSAKPDGAGQDNRPRPVKSFPLGMVLDACPDIIEYARGGIASWRDLVKTTALVRSMLGISQSAWEEACEIMGVEDASVVIAAMLQRAEAIKSAGGYLRSLSERARAGQFSLGPVLMALIRAKHRGVKMSA